MKYDYDFIPKEIFCRLTFAPKKAKGDPDKIQSISYEDQPCEDCGKLVNNRIIEKRMSHSPVPHYRTRCQNCKLIYNPITECYDLTSESSLAFFKRFYSTDDK